jgi:hypothetical protein
LGERFQRWHTAGRFFDRKLVAQAKATGVEDHRDWEAVRRWAEGLHPALMEE